MKGFIDDIEDLAEANEAFRRVLYTGRHMQLVLMHLRPGEEIGLETHAGHDQFFHFLEGEGAAIVDGQRSRIREDDVLLVPAGARHNVVNTGDEPLKFYTLYGPPEHRDGLVQNTAAEATRAILPFDGKTTEPA